MIVTQELALRTRGHTEIIDITPQVIAGTYTTPVLAPGATHLVKVVVTVTETAPAGSSLNASMLVRSDTAAATKDKVRFVTSGA